MRAWAAVAARSARCAAATAVGVGLAVTMTPSGAEVRPDVPAIIEAAHCRGDQAPDLGDDPVDGGVTQTVTVSVPRTAIVDVDHAGRVVSAATNTGCRPRPGDDVYVRRPDGTIVPAPPGAFAGMAWRGDFTEGLATPISQIGRGPPGTGT